MTLTLLGRPLVCGVVGLIGLMADYLSRCSDWSQLNGTPGTLISGCRSGRLLLLGQCISMPQRLSDGQLWEGTRIGGGCLEQLLLEFHVVGGRPIPSLQQATLITTLPFRS